MKKWLDSLMTGALIASVIGVIIAILLLVMGFLVKGIISVWGGIF